MSTNAIQSPSLEVRRPSGVCQYEAATNTEFTSLGCAAPRGFLCLLDALLRLVPSSHFQTGTTHGLRAFRGFPLTLAACSSRSMLPLLPFSIRPLSASSDKIRRPSRRLSGSTPEYPHLPGHRSAEASASEATHSSRLGQDTEVSSLCHSESRPTATRRRSTAPVLSAVERALTPHISTLRSHARTSEPDTHRSACGPQTPTDRLRKHTVVSSSSRLESPRASSWRHSRSCDESNTRLDPIRTTPRVLLQHNRSHASIKHTTRIRGSSSVRATCMASCAAMMRRPKWTSGD